MNLDACYQLGHISGTRGLRGEVYLVLDVDHPESYHKMESVLLSLAGTGPLIPFFIEYLKPQARKLVAKFEEANTQEEAKALVGSTLHLPLDQLPALHGSAYYYHEIIGSTVIDANLGALGTASAIYDQSPQMLIGMQYRNQEVLIPFTDDIVNNFDRELHQLNVTLPDGLLDIYLEDQNSKYED